MAAAAKSHKLPNVWLLVLFIVLEVAAMATLYVSGIALTSVDGFYKGVTAFAIIAIGLTLPYWILKILMHVAHLNNPHEEELRLVDLPKDERRVKRSRAKRK